MKKWLAVPPQPEIPRNEMLLKLFFGEQVATEILIRYVERMAEEHRTLLEVLERAERDEIDKNQQYPAAPYWRMAAHYGQMEMRAHLRWAEETLAELNKIVRKQRARVETHKEKDMQPNEVLAATNRELRQKPPQIASWRHLIGFLLIGAGVVALGLLAQHASTGGGPGASTGQLGRHSQAIHIYLVASLMDWALLYYCWAGVHRHGGNHPPCHAAVLVAYRVSAAAALAPITLVWACNGGSRPRRTRRNPLAPTRAPPTKTRTSEAPHPRRVADAYVTGA